MSNSNYIFNEIASGLINGVNKVFNVAHPITNVESLRIGYVDYTNFTFSGNTITLNDAPTVISGQVFVDYFYEAGAPSFDSVNLIYDEELSGTVDGVNKIFYSVYPIGLIDELRIGGVVYTSFTVNGRAVTLASAPSIVIGAPRIDYYRKDVDVNYIESGYTLSSLRNAIYLRIGQTITSLQYPLALADEWITEGVTRISKMKRDRVKRGTFAFHKAADGVIVSSDGNTINVGTTSKYLPGRGLAIIEDGDAFAYSNKSSTSISSIGGLELSEIEGLKIQYGYKLSKNINKVSEVFLNGFKLSPVDFAEYRFKNNPSEYSVYNGYLFLPYLVSDGDIVNVVYVASHTSTYSDNDVIDFNGDYMGLIKSFVLYNMYRDREDDRHDREFNNYKQLLREYKRELSKEFENTNSVMGYAGPSIG